MSALKLGQPLYKLFEPGYHPQRPIIVDSDALESPDTVTLRYEEEAAVRANGGGGDLRGGSSPDLLPMAAYKPHPPQMHGYSEPSYSQYSPQNIPQAHLQQQTENASQMNQIAYAANNAAVAANNQNAYNFNLAPSGFTCQGCQPSAGSSGTKIQLRISGHYDIMSMTSTPPYAWVLFGNSAQKSPAQILKESQDASGACSYRVTVEAPPFLLTNWQTTSSVPLTITIESADGNELARVGSAGSFTYTDPAGGSADLSQGAASPPDDSITRRSPTRSPPSHEHETSVLQVNSPPSLTVRTSATTSPTTEHLPGAHQLPQHHDVADPSTNTYGYPPSAVAPTQSQLQVHHAQPATNYGAAAAYNPSNDTMLHAYRTSNYAQHHPHHYQRSPTSLRSPHHGLGTWATYGGLDGRSAGYSSSHHTQITRPGLQPSLPIPSGGPPTLVRTTTLPQGNPSMGLGGAYNPFPQHQKAMLHIQGNLESMAVNWNAEEWENKRRIVMFKKSQSGNRLNATFRPVPVNERPPNNIYVSCIWWEEKQECFVTSVDTIHLLEQLVAAPNRFTVEEKNRIRRNLEGFKPLTVSKGKAESEDFFKVIMGFGNPKPRNIEKDVKVFPWKILGPALKKIISKYSASPSSQVPQSTHHPHLLTPVSVSSNYGLPPTPTTATDPTSAIGYISNTGLGHHASLQESIPSPRSLTGGMHSSWAAYSGRDVSRAMSPSGVLKTASPTHNSSLRLSSLSTAYDTRSSQSGVSSHYGLPSQNSHQGLPAAQQSHTGRWDYSLNAISDTAGTYSSSRGGYEYGGYGDGTSQRA